MDPEHKGCDPDNLNQVREYGKIENMLIKKKTGWDYDAEGEKVSNYDEEDTDDEEDSEYDDKSDADDERTQSTMMRSLGTCPEDTDDEEDSEFDNEEPE